MLRQLTGITAAVVQGGLARKIIPAIGERASLLGGILIGTVAFFLYGVATQGWMIYALIPLGALANIAPPALQGLVSRQVPAIEQGSLQGTLASLGSLAGVIAPPRDGLACRFADFDIEIREWFVSHENSRIDDEGSGQSHALTHPS